MNADFTDRLMENYYPCCGKSICKGCVYSYCRSKTKNAEKCPFCNSDRTIKTDEDAVKEMMKRLEVNDASAISVLAGWYYCGVQSCQQNQMKAVELYTRAAELGYGTAHSCLGDYFCEGGNMNKAKFHWEAAAMAGHHEARYNLGVMEGKSGNMERALKHWTISASAGDYKAMHCLVKNFKRGLVSRESIDSTLTAYNKSCTEMRSDARDAAIRKVLANN
jgi:TPR repeat protein